MASQTINFNGPKGGNAPHGVANVYDSLGSFVDHIQATQNHAQNSYLKRASATNSWSGNISGKTAIKYARQGNLASVEASDKLLTEMEQYLNFGVSKFERFNTVAGGAVNVPAYISGAPASMVSRRRTMSEQAPLSIIVDLSTSASIDADQLQARGVAILALVRALAIVRPVTLHVMDAGQFGGYSDGTNANIIAMDTAPLDLARAAFVLTSPAMARQLCFHASNQQALKRNSGNVANGSIQWPFNDHSWSTRNMGKVAADAIGAAEYLYIAGAFSSDGIIKKPTEWLKEKISEYGAETLNAA